jgi:hypothetical protein
LSSKIWQKLMILDRIRSDPEHQKVEASPTLTEYVQPAGPAVERSR